MDGRIRSIVVVFTLLFACLALPVGALQPPNQQPLHEGLFNEEQQLSYITSAIWRLAFGPNHLVTTAMMASPDDGGGTKCIACTVVTRALQEYARVHAQRVVDVVEHVCDKVPTDFQPLCTFLVHKYGGKVVDLLDKKYTADDVCLTLNVCTNPECRLVRQETYKYHPQNVQELPLIGGEQALLLSGIVDWLKKLLDTIAKKHEPILDVDKDLFSPLETLRGSNWRGRDCNDLMDDIYPGVGWTAEENSDLDHNCNGIRGHDDSGRSYEETFCANSGAHGTVILGDSAAAHFRIPTQWLNASQIHAGAFDHTMAILSNEFDWPHHSGVTGYTNDTTGEDSGWVNSIYSHMRRRNRCNHRDYQNIAVNGARVGSMAPPNGIVASFARNPKRDNPVVLFHALVGNDVCHPSRNLDAMTTPSEFEEKVLATLEYLDRTLPQKSHVIFIGLADGMVLWDALHDRMHPLNVPYPDVYDYLNCLESCPCWAWMNKNATIREAGSQRARELSAVYTKIISQQTYANFDMIYFDFPFNAIRKEWEAQGGQVWELIEPVDGFHPTQTAGTLMAEFLWNKLVMEHPEVVGDVNPFNADIERLFGDQGGH